MKPAKGGIARDLTAPAMAIGSNPLSSTSIEINQLDRDRLSYEWVDWSAELVTVNLVHMPACQ